MLTSNLDIERFFRRADAVASVATAADLFSFLRRTFAVPTGWAALETRTAGDRILHRSGTELNEDEVREVFFARTGPIDLYFDDVYATSSDQHDCSASLHLRMLVVPDRSELACLRDRLLGSTRTLTATGLTRYLHPYVQTALATHARGLPAVELVERLDQAAVDQAVRTALAAATFAAGVQVAELVAAEFTSPSFRQAVAAELAVTRDRRQQEAQRQLDESRAAAQKQHLDHLSGILARLDGLARQSPSVGLSALIQTFSESERGEIYEALFASSRPARRTRWIVVAAGNELLYFDPAATESPGRRVSLDTPLGALRSAGAVSGADATVSLLVGAARGVHLLDSNDGRRSSFAVPETVDVRGGFNAATLAGQSRLLATHSELGLWTWELPDGRSPRPIFTELTCGARSVRHAQCFADQLYLSVDDKVIVANCEPDAESALQLLAAGGAAITALCATAQGVFAGDADGQVLWWGRSRDGQLDEAPRRLYGPTRRPIESIACLELGGIPRLFFTDSSPAVHARVLGDSFTCDYQAGGQILRRVAVSDDLVVATANARDRLILWSINEPARPCGMIAVSRLTGRSIQDVCLVTAPLTGNTA